MAAKLMRIRSEISNPKSQISLPSFCKENQSMSQPESASAATNRRDFLKTSSLAAVGAGVLANLGSLPGAHAAGDDTIKVGLIGCGGRGTGAAGQAISTSGKVKLVAMADAFEDRLQGC